MSFFIFGGVNRVEWGFGFYLHSTRGLNKICNTCMIILWNNVNKLVNSLPIFVNLVNNISNMCDSKEIMAFSVTQI